MTVPSAAAEGFAKAGADYERGRPTYPQAAIDRLAEIAVLGPGTVVADVGAGTGKLTRLLAGTGSTVIAIEPVEGMAEVLRAALPDVDVRSGAAERLPLAAGSVSAITVGQAFTTTSLFSTLQSVSFPNPQLLSPDEMAARVRSISIIGALQELQQSDVLAGVARVLAEHPDTAGLQELVLPHTTTLSWCRRR